VFGLDISSAMVSEARRLNPDIDFAEADMLSLPLHPESLGGIAAFHSIIHLKQDELALAFGEMWRALKRDGLLLVAFHLGSEILQTTELWGYRVALEATLFQVPEIVVCLKAGGLHADEFFERDPYPEVEYQSRRGYVLASKPPKEEVY
jgi:SAM-dependent methyltransferase